ncbi:hypothetical protein ACJ41O_007222 [Fusarium nematophilum]
MGLTCQTNRGRPTAWKLEVPSLTRKAVTPSTTNLLDTELQYLVQKGPGLPTAPFDLSGGNISSSIVTIRSRFENLQTGNSIWKIGAGWLIRPDLLITSGDVVYDTEYDLGTASQIECYMSANSLDVPEVSVAEPRYGIKVNTSAGWIDGTETRSRDIAFVQLAKAAPAGVEVLVPAEVAVPVGPEPEAVVVPEPKPEVESEPVQEPLVEFNEPDDNSGTAVAPVEEPVPEIPVTFPEPDPEDFVEVIPEQDTLSEQTVEPKTQEIEPEIEADPFLETLKTVAAIDETDISGPPTTSALHGPVGVLTSVAAGALLNTLVGADNLETEISAAGVRASVPGSAERALLAEAALQAVFAVQESPELDDILEDMKRKWTAHAPEVNDLATISRSYLAECALAIDQYRQTVGEPVQNGRVSMNANRQHLAIRSVSGSVEAQVLGFVQGLFKPTIPLPGQEHLFSSIGPVLRKAVTAACQIVSPDTRASLADRLPKILPKIQNLSRNVQEEQTVGADDQTIRVLIHRAIMADVALQSLMTLSVEKLEALTVRVDGSPEAEHIHDFLKRVIQEIGPLCLEPAKKTAKKFAPVFVEAPAKTTYQQQTVVTTKTTATKKFVLREMLNGRGKAIKMSG